MPQQTGPTRRRQLGRHTFATLTLLLLCALAQPAASQNINFSGFTNSPLGNANLSIDVNGRLLVENLGNSGSDGVLAALGTADYGQITFASIPPLTEASELKICANGQVNGGPGQTFACISVTGTGVGTTANVFADFSVLGASSFTLEIYNGSNLVFSGAINPQDNIGLQNPQWQTFLPFIPLDDGAGGIAAVVTLAAADQITEPNGSTVTGDRIVVKSSDATATVDFVSAIEARAVDDISEFTIANESVGLFGSSHSGLGQALLDATGGQLAVSNLGASGNDGVLLDLTGYVDPDYLVETAPISLQAGSGAALLLEGKGTVNGAPGQTYGTLELRDGGSTFLVSPCWLPVGASGVQVQVFNQGALAGTAMVPNEDGGALAGTVGPIEVVRAETGTVDPDMIVGFAGLVSYSPPATALGKISGSAATTSAALVGDEIRFSAVSPTATVSSLSAFEIRTANIPAFTIIGEGSRATPPAFPFALLANNEILLNGLANSEGDLHSNNDIVIKKGTNKTLLGNLTAVDDITIDKKNIIDGDASAGNKVKNSGKITGTVTEDAAVAVQPLPEVNFSAGGKDIRVKKGKTLALAPDSYGEVKVEKNGVLALGAGEYFMESLILDKQAALAIDISGGAVSINVEDKLEFGQKAKVEILGGNENTGLVTFNFEKSQAVILGKQATVLGTIIAPRANVTLENGARFKGAIIAEEIEVEKNAVFLHHSSSTPLPKTDPPAEAEAGEEIAESPALPTAFALLQNYPNPFNPSTVIGFQLPVASEVRLSIYNINGQLVKRLVNREFAPGSHELVWDATNARGERVSSGVYLYVLRAGSFTAQRKLLLMR